jgi:hypothetical protein
VPTFRRNPVPPLHRHFADGLPFFLERASALYRKLLVKHNQLLRNMRFNPEDLVSQSTAARMRGVTMQAIQNLIERGKLKAVVIDRHIFLLRSEVEQFKPSKGGRPKAKAGTKKQGSPSKP